MAGLKHINSALLVGVLILTLVAAVVLFPSIFTSINPYATESLKVDRDLDGNFAFQRPPFKPDDFNRLGSDEMGRDVWSLLIYGARLTLAIGLVVAFCRFGLGLLVGIPAAYGSRLARNLIHQSNIVFNFVPPLIICILILKMRFFESLPKTLSFWVFVLVLTLVGWARVGQHIQDRSKSILSQDFIRSEITMGKGPATIALQNVLSHLAAELTVLFFMEMAVVLGLMMQLGAFSVFIGNLRIIENTDNGMITYKPMSFEPEWSAMMGASGAYIRTAPWLVLSPAVAFFVSILGFNLVGEGLRSAFQQQNAKLASLVKGKVKWATGLVLGLLVLSLVVNTSQTQGGTEAKISKGPCPKPLQNG